MIFVAIKFGLAACTGGVVRNENENGVVKPRFLFCILN